MCFLEATGAPAREAGPAGKAGPGASPLPLLNVAFAHPEQLIEVPSFWGRYSGGCGAATELAGIRCCKGMEFLVLGTQTLLATNT